MRVVLSAIALSVLAACTIFPAKHSFRLTLEVESDGQINTASSVYRVTAFEFISPSGWQLQLDTEGDAIFMDLGEGRNLLAIIGVGDGWEGNFANLSHDVFVRKPRGKNLAPYRQLASMTGRAELPRRLLPHLATLPDINDPKSLRFVSETNFEAVFGDRVKFRRVTIELTRDRVTRGITKILTWLPAMQEAEKTGVQSFRSGGPWIWSRIFTRTS